MWIEISDRLINLDHVFKIKPNRKLNHLELFTNRITIEIKLKNKEELEQVYFNLVEIINSRPVDGFREL